MNIRPKSNPIPANLFFYLAFTLLIVLTVSCIDEIKIDLGDTYETLLVVDGGITNEAPPYTVKLSWSSRLEYLPKFVPIENCNVEIMDDFGNIEVLEEKDKGIYVSSESGLQGMPGRSYKIRILLADGKQYESDFERMEEPIEIDSVYFENEFIYDDELQHNLNGIRFYLDTKESNLEEAYFLWKLYGTYEYNANYFIKYMFDGSMHPFEQFDSLYTCYRNYTIPEIFTEQTANLSGNAIENYPLHYVDTEDKRLSIRYSLLVKQHIVSREAYEFWNHLREQENNSGSIYSVLPFQLVGNVFCTDDPTEPVLGYFNVSSVNSRRIFVNRPTDLEFYYQTECPLITEDIYTVLWLWKDQWPLYLPASYIGTFQTPVLTGSQQCVDCTESGGVLEIPEFWIE